MDKWITAIFKKIKIWAEMIKLEHTIFSAPFMLSAMLLASDDKFPSLFTVFWACLALIGARSSAMTLNRLIDANIDALNPRTANRAIPTGKLSRQLASFLSILGFIFLTIAALNLPRMCLYLLPIAIVWLSFYSYVKRFSWLAHFVLGIALSGAVLGGWLAVTGSLCIFAFLFALAICFWVSGFDILYALQDLEFDCQNGLHSIPSKFGQKKALLIARISHFNSLIFFVWAGFKLDVSMTILISYWMGICFLSIGLIVEHYIIYIDLRKVEIAFFIANAFISSMFFICILIGKFLNSTPILQ